MVQEGAAAAPAPVGGAPGAAKKKKNKSKNKKKTGAAPAGGQPQQQSAGGSESRSRTNSDTGAGQSPQQEQSKPAAPVAAPVEPVVNRALPIAKDDRKANDLVSNLAREVAENFAKYSNYSEVRDAEKLYYQHLAKNKAPAPAKAAAPVAKAEDDDDIDFFASDDEEEKPKAKPQFVKVQSKGPPPSVLAKQKEQAAKKKGGKAADKAPVEEKPKKEVEPKKPAEAPLEKKTEAPKPVESSSSTSGQILTCKNPANCERTFLMLKPDAVHRGLAGQIIARFEKKGFKLVAMKFMKASTDLLSKHYADLSKKPFFPELVRYMASGPVLPMVWEGLNVVKTGRVMLGETNPKDSAPGTIRGDFCIDIGRNIIHGSDSVESAQKEIGLWFSPYELVNWRPNPIPWVYEDEEDEPEQVDGIADMAGGAELVTKLNSLEIENKNLKKVTEDLRNLVLTLEKRVASLEGKSGGSAPAPKPAAAAPAADDDDDVDLFGSSDEEEDADAARVREERLKAYAEKKSKKPALIAKTSVLLDVKPWDDETDMDAMLKAVKSIEKEGLVWGASKLVPVGYGINKLQVMCVVEDEKVSIDELSEQIQEFEDFVQSVDIAAMSKI